MTRLGTYRLERIIGEGGMGVVHLGRDAAGGPVAVKVLRPQVIGDSEARERLAREVSSMQLVHSRWVAEVIDADPWGETPYVVTRYVPGRSLYETVRDDGPLSGDALLWLARGLLEGISAVHDAGVLHRDIKPSNVLMEGQTPVLIDFGLARVADDPRLTQNGWLLGTPGYLAPEVLYGDDPTTAVDVHAWAGTVVYAATGRPPFGRGPAMAIMDRTRRGEHDLSGIEGELRDVLADALAAEPSDRPRLDQIRSWLARQGSDPTTQLARLSRADLMPPAEAATQVISHEPETARLPAEIPPAPPNVGQWGGGAPGWSHGQLPHQPPHHGVAGEYPPSPYEAYPTARPRLGLGERTKRLVLWLLVTATCAGALAAYPWLGAGVILAGVWLLRAGSAAAARLDARRAERGAQWYDGPKLVLSAPVEVIRTLPATVILALWAMGMVVASVLFCYAVAAPVHISLMISGVVFVLALLLGPGGGEVRSPLARVIDPISVGNKGWLIAALVLLALAGLAGGLAARGADWTPFLQAPFSGLME